MNASVEIFLPLCDDAGDTFPSDIYSDEVLQLEKQFGHVTKTVVSLPEVFGQRRGGVTLKVQVNTVDIDWWRTCCRRLKSAFGVSNIRIWATTPHPL